jgi:hypothetical protein
MNVEIGTEAAQFPEKEYKNGIFLVVVILWSVSGICGRKGKRGLRDGGRR